MNTVGRQMQKSGSNGQNQRQFSDNFIEKTFNNKWLQSAGLHHLQSSNTSVTPLQDFGFYAANWGVQGSRIGRNGQGGSGEQGNEEPSTPPALSRSSSMRKNGDVEGLSPSDLSPGLLDLHAFDTELIPEAPSKYDGSSNNQPVQGKSFNDSELFYSGNKLSSNANGLIDRDRANSVSKIRVVVRKRPLNKKEITKKEGDIITIDPKMNSLTVHETKLKVDLTEYVEKHEFTFDAVLDENVTNNDVYAETVEPVVPIIFQRTKATCFAYGQTGSGKTYTMQPLPLKASHDIFRLMNQNYRHQGFQLFVSFFEIYGGKVFDLLNDRKKLFMREDGKQQVCIVGLQEYNVYNVATIKELIERGNATRSTGTTGANEESSRSHAILQLAIKRTVDGNESKPPRLVGKLSFIDLAGSERGADTTDNDKQTRMEGAEINKSLLALKECIRALDNDRDHIPFRGSKLTEVLRDSFVGDSRTVMISCISPNSGSCEHTLNTLRYADRVKSLSKCNNTRKDPLRNCIAVPSSSISPTVSGTEDSLTDVLQDSSIFGWSKKTERGPSPSFNIECAPSGRLLNNVASDVSINNKVQKIGQDYSREDNHHTPEEIYMVGKPSLMSNITFDHSQKAYLEDRMWKSLNQTKHRDLSGYKAENPSSGVDLIALLKEEEDLISSHRRLVEETMNIVKEEMNLLVGVDQPGSQVDDYMSRLNAILTQKAAGILNLQARLAQFQKHLKESSVIVSSSNQ